MLASGCVHLNERGLRMNPSLGYNHSVMPNGCLLMDTDGCNLRLEA
jgi:hypothetical protein